MEGAQSTQSQLDYFGGLKTLDVGCGAGILSESLGRLGFGHVTGIDPTDKCIELAQQHLDLDPVLKHKVTYKNTTVEQLWTDSLTSIQEKGGIPPTP